MLYILFMKESLLSKYALEKKTEQKKARCEDMKCFPQFCILLRESPLRDFPLSCLRKERNRNFVIFTSIRDGQSLKRGTPRKDLEFHEGL